MSSRVRRKHEAYELGRSMYMVRIHTSDNMACIGTLVINRRRVSYPQCALVLLGSKVSFECEEVIL